MCIGIGLYIRIVKQLYGVFLEALDYKNQTAVLKPFCIVGALTLSAFYGYCVCCFFVKSMNNLQKEREWIDIEENDTRENIEKG